YDGACDDGGETGEGFCELGSDCYDCGERSVTITNDSSTGASRYVFNAASADTLKDSFKDLALAISRQLKGMYLLAYCSPTRSGTHTLTVNVQESVSPNSRGFDFTFDAQNFAPGCSADFFESVCDGRQCGGFNCGACNEESEVCEAATGTCEDACLANNVCDGRTLNNSGHELVCDFSEQSIGQCGGACIDL